MATWPLISVESLDPVPGGRYTQIRNMPKQAAVVLWNSNGNGSAPPGLRLAHCITPDCRIWAAPRTVAGIDPNPRYVRMELLTAPDGLGTPLLALGASNSSALHLVRCHDALCGTRGGHGGLSTLTLASSWHKVRHPDLLLQHRDTNISTATSVLVAATLCSTTGCELRLFGCSLTLPPVETTSTCDDGAVIARSAPFVVDEKTKLPTGGLEDPSLAEYDLPNASAGSVGGEGGRGVALAYWHVEARILLLTLDAARPERRHTITVANGSSSANFSSSPGAWVRLAQGGAAQLLVFYFDLPRGALHLARCAPAARACGAPALLDGGVGRGDVSDYGAGGFPELSWPPPSYRSAGLAAGPTLIYFSDAAARNAGRGGAAAVVGELRAIFCKDATCSAWTRRVLARGAAGFGRDASLAYAERGPQQRPALMVSFLDLQGEDTPDGMVARLALFEPESPAPRARDQPEPDVHDAPTVEG